MPQYISEPLLQCYEMAYKIALNMESIEANTVKVARLNV